MSKTRILYAMLAIAAAVWVVLRMGGGPEAEIRRLLGEVEELTEKAAGEGALDGVGRAKSFAELFAEPFSAEVAPAGQQIGDRQRLMQVFLGFRHASERVTLDYRNVAIEVAEGKKQARVTLEAILNGGPAGMLANESFPVELFLVKQDGDWKIDKAKVGDPVRD